MPELPSLLGLLLLNGFMETHIVRGYRELGCRIPHGCSSVRVIRNRPFINVTCGLLWSSCVQRRAHHDFCGRYSTGTGLTSPMVCPGSSIRCRFTPREDNVSPPLEWFDVLSAPGNSR